MSRAFTKEDDDTEAIAMIGERPVSAHRNLVTPEGLKQIDAEIERLRVEMAKAEGARDRASIAKVSRELRYWSARRTSAGSSCMLSTSTATPGADFDRVNGHGYVRFSFAGTGADMEEGMARLARWLG